MQNFSRAERIAAAVYLIWLFVHIGLFFYSEQNADNSLFWPFIPGDKTVITTYDLSEFAVYTLAPVILFIAYKIMFGKTYEEQQAARRHSTNFLVAFLDEKIKAEELTQKLNSLQNIPGSSSLLEELKSDREKAADQSINNWHGRLEVRKKYKDFEG
jgi:hypothetical protein